MAHRFESVAKKYPKSPRAPDSLFTAAQLLSDLSRISLLAEDATASMDDDRALLETYPRSPLADDAALALAQAYLDREQPDAARKVLQRAAQLPKGDQTARLRALAASLPPEAKEPARKAGKAESLARRETPPPEPRTREHAASPPRRADRRRPPARTFLPSSIDTPRPRAGVTLARARLHVFPPRPDPPRWSPSVRARRSRPPTG